MAINKNLEYFKILEDHCVDIPNRVIYLVGDIVTDVIETAVQQLHYLMSPTHCGKQSEDSVTIMLNSCGGHDDMMFYLYDAITSSECPVITIGTGMICSAAALILVCGDERYATPNSWFMTHKGKVILEGDEDDIQAQAELNKKISQRYWKLLARHTKLSAQRWLSRSKNLGELWLEPSEMLKYGVIDAILEPTRRELPPLPKRSIRISKGEDEDAEREE